MDYFDAAQAIAKGWPGDIEAPRKLRTLFDSTPPESAADVAMFVEAHYAAAQTDKHISLIDAAWEGTEEEE